MSYINGFDITKKKSGMGLDGKGFKMSKQNEVKQKMAQRIKELRKQATMLLEATEELERLALPDTEIDEHWVDDAMYQAVRISMRSQRCHIEAQAMQVEIVEFGHEQ